MAVLRPKNVNIQLLACLVDEDDTNDSDYRFLADGQRARYVTTAPGTFVGAEDDRTFEPILLGELFPPFPSGSWNQGHVAKDTATGETAFVKTETVQLAGVKNIWHPVKLNEFDFTQQHRIRQRVRVATHPELNNGKPVLMKLAVWPWEIASMEVETTAYQFIDGRSIGPKFLGHVTEGNDGRVVGFIIEWVQDARAAGLEDIESCKMALGRLHKLNIKSGDINKHNFLVRDGQDTVLIDFETAEFGCSPEELDLETGTLEHTLQDKSSRGGVEPHREQ
ncbi:hypothetical protein O1611_g3664 [Lasiodiplodia mahajangana]|uniref:Uncharacterized protein n=1 Tax=Lasiodiplodia mahajangana TaxID=1108764 RepID=A0ACC2JR34_9PEZI|nr:hypothetical protein O1611_g3664 [Lasiodiplodia mahajangana]